MILDAALVGALFAAAVYCTSRALRTPRAHRRVVKASDLVRSTRVVTSYCCPQCSSARVLTLYDARRTVGRAPLCACGTYMAPVNGRPR